MYDSLFFVGLEPSSGRKTPTGNRMMRRPSNSPFFTPAEQVGQQFIREELSDAEEGDRYNNRDQHEANRLEKEKKEQILIDIEELDMYIADLREEIGVIDVTLVAAEGSGETETKQYRLNLEESDRLKRKLREAERDMGILNTEFSKYS